jgi:hypothetical protein
MIIVMKLTSTSGDQGLITNGNGVPKLTISSGIIAINSGSAVTGPVSIGTGATIITWVNFGASSRIDTNGVLYVSGNAGTTGFASGQGIYIAHPIVNQFNGEINRIWCWTNTLSAGNLQAAITQCGTDFGIHTPYTP